MSRQGIERGISGVQSLGEPALGCNEGGKSLHPIRQCFERLALGCEDRRGIGAGIHFATENSSDEVCAPREVPIDSTDPDARFFRDLSHRSIHSGSREHRGR